ncbi:type-F conjugative transfer system protein TraW [Sphingobium sp. CFD-2]|uniref:type-F conjugative transfer system protein TraW n=1 Tax=Sphingobium sp. CFD-2 TaxID=2878542 RepID=UPI00214B6FC9|nr:type-F conjugative transfer system protein TraW [Sphingobium sp. CFD-2]
MHLVTAALGILALVGAAGTHAKDYGRAGQTFPVIEPDLLTTIENRLKRAQASGDLARLNALFAKRAEAKIRRPDPVRGVSPATSPREWDFDPSVTLEQDIRDQKGQLIAAAGQRINPLDFLTVRQALVFIDGDDAAQVDWATARYDDSQAKIIFVSGSPIDLMTHRQRRFYFDQEGRLTGRFGIQHIPAVVKPAGKFMRISEIPLPSGKQG